MLTHESVNMDLEKFACFCHDVFPAFLANEDDDGASLHCCVEVRGTGGE